MPKFFITEEQINGDKIKIIGKDVNHIKNVLRQKVGDKIVVCNSDNQQDYLCNVEEISEKNIFCNIVEKLEDNTESNIKVSIFQGLPKADKMELVIQKSVELGVYDITPVEMKRCVVKLNDKDKFKKIERWQKISEVASKQCGRNIIPNVNNIISLNDFLMLKNEYDLLMVAYENERENTLKNELTNISKLTSNKKIKIGILIGPEGGIAEEEIRKIKENGIKIITLGKRILRTETVALNVLSNIMYELEQ